MARKSDFESSKVTLTIPHLPEERKMGVKVQWAYLKEKQVSEKYGTEEYRIRGLLHKEEDAHIIEYIEEQVINICSDSWGDGVESRINSGQTKGSKKEIGSPLRDGADIFEESDSDNVPEWLNDYYVIDLKNKRNQPACVIFQGDGKKSLTPEHKDFDWDSIYDGCYCTLVFELYTWNSGGDRVCTGLRGVMKVDDGEPLAGNVKPTVDSVFGDMLGEMGAIDGDSDDLFDDDETGEAPEITDEQLDGEDEEEETPEPPAKKKTTRRRRKTETKVESDPLDDDEEPAPTRGRRKASNTGSGPRRSERTQSAGRKRRSTSA